MTKLRNARESAIYTKIPRLKKIHRHFQIFKISRLFQVIQICGDLGLNKMFQKFVNNISNYQIIQRISVIPTAVGLTISQSMTFQFICPNYLELTDINLQMTATQESRPSRYHVHVSESAIGRFLLAY